MTAFGRVSRKTLAFGGAGYVRVRNEDADTGDRGAEQLPVYAGDDLLVASDRPKEWQLT
jgi:hypothetical protein